MKKIYRSLLALSLCSIITFQPCSAEDLAVPEQIKKEEILIQKESDLEAKDRVSIEKRLSKKERKARQLERKVIADKTKAAAKACKKKCLPNMFSKHAEPVYRIKSIGANGKTLTFDNEAIWEISDSYASVVKHWMPGSYVVIIPNTSWLSSYTYRLENLSDNRSQARANLSEGPFMKYATYITFIDHISNTIGLTDNTVWSMNWDTATIGKTRSWTQGQAVLLGQNRGWFGWACGNIMININENHYVPVSSYR